MDEGDLGNRSADFHLARAILAARDGAALNGDSLTECENCGQPIPEGRRKAVPGCRYCVWCQAELEK